MQPIRIGKGFRAVCMSLIYKQVPLFKLIIIQEKEPVGAYSP